MNEWIIISLTGNAFQTFTGLYINPMHAALFATPQFPHYGDEFRDFVIFRGKMIASDLDQKIEKAKAEGARPFFVSATAGTTVLGAIDPLHEVADVCEKHKLWFHVDVS